MPKFLQYGDALALLNEIDSRLGQRKLYPLVLQLACVEIDANKYQDTPFEKDTVMLYKTTEGDICSYDEFWRRFDRYDIADQFCLARDETTKEFESRRQESKRVIDNKAAQKAPHSIEVIKRPYPVYSANKYMTFNTVSHRVNDVKRQISLYCVGTTGYLSPRDITDIVLAFLIKGSESKETFLCDTKIQSPSTLFTKPKQFSGNAFINDLLMRYNLLDDDHKTIDDFKTLSKARAFEVERQLQQASQSQLKHNASKPIMSRMMSSLKY